MKEQNIIRKYKIIAIVGIVLMGIGSFMCCLATDKNISNIGTVILVVSIFISVLGFSKWQP